MLLERQLIGKSKKEVKEVLKNRGYAFFEEVEVSDSIEGYYIHAIDGYYIHASVCVKTIRVFFYSGKAIDFEIF